MSITSAMHYTPLVVLAAFTLPACQSTPIKTDAGQQKPRWFNTQVFKDIGTSPYDLEFENEFTAVDNSVVSISNCEDLAVVGDGKIAEREYTRWQAIKVDCQAASRFYLSPESAKSYWPDTFEFPLLKTLPAAAIPYLGGQGLEGRNGNLADVEATLTLLDSGEHSVKVSFNSMVVNYVVISRGDFNHDGYQDLFVRMDWYVEDAFGGGHDWAVFTKLSTNAAPMMLWRK